MFCPSPVDAQYSPTFSLLLSLAAGVWSRLLILGQTEQLLDLLHVLAGVAVLRSDVQVPDQLVRQLQTRCPEDAQKGRDRLVSDKTSGRHVAFDVCLNTCHHSASRSS